VVIWLHVSAFFGHSQGGIQQRKILPMHIYGLNRDVTVFVFCFVQYVPKNDRKMTKNVAGLQYVCILLHLFIVQLLEYV
jgi:hypothetical protein